MNVRPRIYGLYIGRTVLLSVLVVWLVLLALDAILALSGEVNNIGKGQYSFGHALAWTAYTLPMRSYTLFPMAAVIGALMGLGQLAATSELTALRALGLSRLRIAVSTALTLALLTALMVLNGETLAPWSRNQADMLKANARSGTNLNIARYSGLWAREGDTFLNARSGEEQRGPHGQASLLLHDVYLYHIDDDGRLRALTYAKQAQHDANGWQLQNVQRDTFTQNTARREHIDTLAWDSQLDAVALASGLTRPRNMSSQELRSSIDYRKRNHLDTQDFEDTYWSRWFYPLNVLALCLVATPFAFGSLRSGGMGKRLFVGMVFALGFLLLQMFFGRMAGALHFDYRFAYATPPLLLLGISIWLFRRN